MNTRFQDRVVLITGGASGIGRSAAELFAHEGAKVIVADRDRENGRQVADGLQSLGGEALYVHVDVTSADSVAAMVDAAVERFGRIDSLFHSAGIFELGLITEVDEAHWDRIIDVNLKGTFLVLKSVLPVMLDGGGGTIVTAASIAGLVPFPNNPVYIASKAGVIMFTKCIARDYGEFNIRANVICPSPVEGPMMARALERADDPAAEKRLLEEGTLLKRFAKPEEVARAVLFLASDDSSYISGESLLIDGGKLTMNK